MLIIIESDDSSNKGTTLGSSDQSVSLQEELKRYIEELKYAKSEKEYFEEECKSYEEQISELKKNLADTTAKSDAYEKQILNNQNAMVTLNDEIQRLNEEYESLYEIVFSGESDLPRKLVDDMKETINNVLFIVAYLYLVDI